MSRLEMFLRELKLTPKQSKNKKSSYDKILREKTTKNTYPYVSKHKKQTKDTLKYEFLRDEVLDRLIDEDRIDEINKVHSIYNIRPTERQQLSYLTDSLSYYKELRKKYSINKAVKKIINKQAEKNEKKELMIEDEKENQEKMVNDEPKLSLYLEEIKKNVEKLIDPIDLKTYGLFLDTFEEDVNSFYSDKDEDQQLEGISTLAEIQREYHNYLKNKYTDTQIKDTLKNISSSFIIEDSNNLNSFKKCRSDIVLEYFSFIDTYPELALPTLLWLDTFHDFKDERLKSGKEFDLNKIIDYLCYRIYRRHWGGLEEKGTKRITNYKDEECVLIGHHYNFDKMYQNSFFTFDNNYEVTGFHEDIQHTILKVFKDFKSNDKVAKLLYDVSNIFITQQKDVEDNFLSAYMIYNFGFELGNTESIKEKIKEISWNYISSTHIPYWAKDVDKGSSNFLKGDLVVLPASLFDANRSNSSNVPTDFVDINNTIIPCCNGYKFEYKFANKNNNAPDRNDCTLSLNYFNNSNIYTLCQPQSSIYCASSVDTDISRSLDAINNNLKSASRNITSKNLYSDDNTIKDNLKLVKEHVNKTYIPNDACVKIPSNKQGMSPVDVVSVVIGLLIKAKDNLQYRNENHPLSPISCKELDFWVALKRIGDFGQILQCKQLGIPLFTNDNMQILISMAACSSVVFTTDNTKVLWYDGKTDAFMCNDLAVNYSLYERRYYENEEECSLKRMKDTYKDTINNTLNDVSIEFYPNSKLKNSADSLRGKRSLDDIFIPNIRRNCSISIDLPQISLNPSSSSSSSSSSNPFLSSSSSSSSSSSLNPFLSSSSSSSLNPFLSSSSTLSFSQNTNQSNGKKKEEERKSN